VQDTQRTKPLKVALELIPWYFRIYKKSKTLCKGAKPPFLPANLIPNQRVWKNYLTQSKRKNAILEGLKYLKYMEAMPNATYVNVAKVLGISRTRVYYMVSLVSKLPKKIVNYLANKNEPEYLKYFTERRLRRIVFIKDKKEQIKAFRDLKNEFRARYLSGGCKNYEAHQKLT
jgi:hypothetical protein